VLRQGTSQLGDNHKPSDDLGIILEGLLFSLKLSVSLIRTQIGEVTHLNGANPPDPNLWVSDI
jgi:hypothetical protein